MRVLDLFSGIGGFSLGLERAGMQTVAFCERDPYCRAVLAKHWPQVPCYDDIHGLDAARLAQLGRIDLVCGGFPCQPFSVAGKQRAQADDRHLWPQMCRVIALARPAWVIGENVAGIIRLGLDEVLADLAGLGYAAQAFVIPACAVDAPHRRDRVWIIACDADGESEPALDAPDVLADADGEGLERWERAGLRECAHEWPAGASGALYAVADTDRDHVERRRGNVQMGRRAVEGEAARHGWRPSAEWLPEPDVGRVAHGIPARVDRLRCLGNAVVPQVVEQLGRAILAAQAHAALTMQRP